MQGARASWTSWAPPCPARWGRTERCTPVRALSCMCLGGVLTEIARVMCGCGWEGERTLMQARECALYLGCLLAQPVCAQKHAHRPGVYESSHRTGTGGCAPQHCGADA